MFMIRVSSSLAKAGKLEREASEIRRQHELLQDWVEAVAR